MSSYQYQSGGPAQNSPPPPKTVPAAAFQTLSALHQITLEAFLCKSGQELSFTILNRTVVVSPYDRAFLWRFDDEDRIIPFGVSGKSEVNKRAPLIQEYQDLVKDLADRAKPGALSEESFVENRKGWKKLVSQNKLYSAMWHPITVDSKVVGGIWMERTSGRWPAWEEKDQKLLSSIMVSYAAAWSKLLGTKTLKSKVKDNLKKSRFTRIAILLAVLAMMLPVRLRIGGECEIIPKNPEVIPAPMAGVVEEVLVEPGQFVKEGTTLFKYESAVVMQELEVARKQVDVYRRNLERANSLALEGEEKSRSEIPVLMDKISQQEAQYEIARSKAEKLVVTSPVDGYVIVDSPYEWKGRPVSLGEKIMSIVRPGSTKLQIWLPESDKIELEHNEPVQFFLKQSPYESFRARLKYVARHVSTTPSGIPSFRAEADWFTEDAAMFQEMDLRMGLTGRAFLYGDRVPLAYWIMRKPIASIRKFFGL